MPRADRRRLNAKDLAGCAAAVLTICVGSERAVLAHEAGTTRVVVAFAHDSTYQAELTTDAAALLARLEVARRQPRTSPTTPPELQTRFDALCDEVPRHVSFSFDQRAGAPEAECHVDTTARSSEDLSTVGVTVTLHGSLPPDAATFRWRYDLAFASYALSLKAATPAGGTWVWLEGGEESQAIAIVRLPRGPGRWETLTVYGWFGFTRVLPYGVPHVLFLVGIIGMGRGLRRAAGYGLALGAAECAAIAAGCWRGVALSSATYDPLVAVSLCAIAAAMLVPARLQRNIPAVVFALGLPHGLRLSAALANATLPAAPFALGASAFVVGVLVSQFVVICGLCLLVPINIPSRSLCAEGRHPR